MTAKILMNEDEMDRFVKSGRIDDREKYKINYEDTLDETTSSSIIKANTCCSRLKTKKKK